MKLKRFLFWPFLTLVFGGCAAQNEGAPRSLARDLLAGHLRGGAFDRMLLAERRQSDGSASHRDLQTSGYPVEEVLYLQGQYAADASRQRGGNERQRLRQRTVEKYRAVFQLAPGFEAKDPDVLNNLGYVLADWGQNADDFALAVKATRRALDLLDKQIAALPAASRRLPDLRLSRALGPLDSHAWALFKVGRLEEACRAQAEVLKEIAASRPGQVSQKAEFYFHHAEILRALKRFPEARRDYETAQNLAPDSELSAKIEAGLKAVPPEKLGDDFGL